MTDLVSRLMPEVPGPARWLGLAGLIPFVGLAVTVCFLGDPERAWAVPALIGYGVAILSFMGGCRWGFAACGMGEGPTMWMLGVSVVPALYGWAVGQLIPGFALGGLAIGFLGLMAADLALTRQQGAPSWWPALRWPLTVVAVGALLAAAAAVGFG